MPSDTPEMVNLYLAMDKLRNRYGRDAIGRAVGQKSLSAKEDKNKQEKKTDEVMKSTDVSDLQRKVRLSYGGR